MQIEQLPIEGAFIVTPQLHGDSRGVFFEWFKAATFAAHVGHDMPVAQANCSVSARGTLRGIHFADVPPGQAKYVTCVSGRILDVIVDIRVGSPTFGQWQAIELGPQNRQLVYLSEGLGHGFVALEDASTVLYLCSTAYEPSREHELDPFDSDLAIDWGLRRDNAFLSPKDAAAPSLQAAAAAGTLPVYRECVNYVSSLG